MEAVALGNVHSRCARPSAATSTRVGSRDVAVTRPSGAPSEPPNSISGPSRPIDMPMAMADQDESTRETLRA